MSQKNRDWADLGRRIQNMVEQAVDSQDFRKLGESIRQTVDQVLDAGGEALRSAASGLGSSSRTGSTGTRNVKYLYGKTGGKAIGAVFKILGGVPLTVVMALGFIGWTLSGEPLMEALSSLITTVLCLGGGIWLSRSGLDTFGMIKRFSVYKKLLGQSTHCTVERLSAGVGKPESFVRKDVRKMIRQGYFCQGHLDHEERTLITSDETYRHYEQSRLEFEQRRKLQLQEQKAAEAQAKAAQEKSDPRLQEILERGNAFIDQIRSCNDDIPGEEISAKIARMEDVIRRIFQRAERCPEVIPDLKKLMDYYLPMTVKLLKAYADMDAQPHQGENIQTSKREIEEALDTLNQAYEKLLDDLFADTALDVSSDISVLNTLLAQEGLTVEDFPGVKADKT